MDHHPPPTCPEHNLYRRACDTCRRYRRELYRRRNRAIAYDRWQYKVDAEPAYRHIDGLLQQGMSLRRVADAAGVGFTTVRQIYRQMYTRTTPGVAARILQVTPQGPLTVDSTGTARRLQALGVAQYGLANLSQLTGYSYLSVKRWQLQQPERVTLLTRDTVSYLYRQLWCTDGPDLHAAAAAQASGWYPFEAWTDLSIDDPDAEPYGAPEQRGFVDWVVLNRATLPARHKQRIAFVDLSAAEQLQLWRHHVAAGGSIRGFRDRYRPVPIEIMRWLVQEVPV